ncbi:hypothetical protein ACIQLR_000627 [Photobacterium damselae]
MNIPPYRNNHVEDILSDNPDIIVLLESPGKNELIKGLPVVGKTGEIFSSTLLDENNKKTAAGYYFSETDRRVSIINSIQFGIDFHDLLRPFKKELKPNRNNHLSTFDQKKVINEFKLITEYIQNDYKPRVTNEIYKSFSVKANEKYNQLKDPIEKYNNCVTKILICGSTALAFFQIAFGNEVSTPSIYTHSGLRKIKIKDISIPILIFYANHPISNNWCKEKVDLINIKYFWDTPVDSYIKNI